MIIYKVTNKINGKCYIGQTVKSLDQRKAKHIQDALAQRDDVYFHKAIRKYTIDSFEWKIIHDNITTIEELNKLEIYYIKLYNTYNNGYNLTLGGGGSIGFKHSEKSLKKMRKLCGEKAIWFGKKHTEKTIKKMSETRKRNIEENPDFYIRKGKDNPYFGKNHSEKICAKMRGPRPNISGKNHPNYGKHLSDETKQKIRDNHADFSLGNHPQARAIILIHPDGKEEYFTSMGQPEEKYNLYKGSISSIARGYRKQTKGYKCRYAN